MRSWFVDTNPKEISEIYEALKVFTELCYKPENQFIFKLETGNLNVKYFI